MHTDATIDADPLERLASTTVDSVIVQCNATNSLDTAQNFDNVPAVGSRPRVKRHGPYSQYLVIRCMQSNRDAFGPLIELWHSQMFYYLRRMLDTEESALDVAQNTWLAVYRKIHLLKDARRFPSWLYAIARIEVLKYWRSNYRHRLDQLTAPTEVAAVMDGSAIEDVFDTHELIHEALGRLSIPQREVLTLAFLKDLSVREIAEVLDEPTGTIKSRLYYARKALKDILNQKEQTNDQRP